MISAFVDLENYIIKRELTGRSGRQQREVGRLLGEVNEDYRNIALRPL
jgi:ribosomal protein S18